MNWANSSEKLTIFFNFCLVYDLMALCEPEPDHVLGWPDLENPSSPIWRKKPPSPQDQGSNRGWEWIWIGFGSSWFEFLFFKNMSHLYLFCNHIFICIFIYVSHLETWAHCARFHLGEILSCRSEVDNGRSVDLGETWSGEVDNGRLIGTRPSLGPRRGEEPLNSLQFQ